MEECEKCDGSGEYDTGFGAYKPCWDCEGRGMVDIEIEENEDGE